MNLNERIELALENRNKGYNCCQAVACAFCDVFDVDEELIFKISEGFGLGMGNMEGLCGAVSGAVMLAGLKNSTENPTSKSGTYKLSKEIISKFQDKNSSAICKDLKGVETNKVLRTCPGCIEDAICIVNDVILKNE